MLLHPVHTTSVTRLGDFRLLGDSLLWADFGKLQKHPKFCDAFSTVMLKVKKWVGLHFGRFFSQIHLVNRLTLYASLLKLN
jgi:hypothetical protein